VNISEPCADDSMNNTPSSEPKTDAPAVRRFNNAAYVPLADSLGQIRVAIDLLDRQIIELIAERGRYVKDATRFKRDAFQVSAPARQAEVFERVRLCAQIHCAELPTLPDVVEATYRSMVAAFVAGEQVYFKQTSIIEDAV
jgi:isochorismate pyruvate lyase